MEKKMGPGGNVQLQGIVDVPRGDGSALTGMKKWKGKFYRRGMWDAGMICGEIFRYEKVCPDLKRSAET